MPVANTQDKFVRQLCQAYDAQLRYAEAMQEPAEMAQDGELKNLIQEHMRATRQSIQNLEQVFSQMGMEPSRLETEGSKGLVADGRDDARQAEPGPILDSMLIAGMARVEHAEIAGNKGLIVDAQQSGQDGLVDLLQQNLQRDEQAA